MSGVSVGERRMALVLPERRKLWVSTSGWIIDNHSPDQLGELAATRIEGVGHIGHGYGDADLPVHVELTCWVKGRGRFWVSCDGDHKQWFDLKPKAWGKFTAHRNVVIADPFYGGHFAIGGRNLLIGDVSVFLVPI